MRRNNLFCVFFFCTCLITIHTNGQLNVFGSAGLIIQPGAEVILQGNLSGTTNVGGSGKISLNGAVAQNVSMNDFAIPNLEINNTQNINLTSNLRIQNSLNFVNGKVIAGNYDLTLSDIATSSGIGTGKFIETNNTGQVFKELSGNVISFEIPVGVSTVYRPVFLTTNATAFSGAKVGVKALAVSNPNKPPGSTDYLNAYWPITRTGITGTVTAIGRYADPTDIAGTEVNLRGFFYNGTTQWSVINGTNDAELNRVGAPVTGTGGSLYGMSTDQTLSLNLKLYLQGYYINGGMMKPVLMNQGVHAQLTETDTIVVELHHQTTHALIDAKKALLLTNGTVSATFIQPAGSYFIAIRHRNALQTWTATPVACTASTPLYNFSTAANKVFADNQVQVAAGVWAFFTGDLNQDEFIDPFDFVSFDTDSQSGVNGIYVPTDFNGDGFVDPFDFQVFDGNSQNGVSSIHP